MSVFKLTSRTDFQTIYVKGRLLEVVSYPLIPLSQCTVAKTEVGRLDNVERMLLLLRF